MFVAARVVMLLGKGESFLALCVMVQVGCLWESLNEVYAPSPALPPLLLLMLGTKSRL